VLEGKHKRPGRRTSTPATTSSSSTPRGSPVTSDKKETKLYIRHSGHPQGLKEETLGHLLERRPEEVIRRPVKGMLPRNRLGVQQLRKLKVYAGTDHPHQAQRPEPLA
jgi:large subunit ribosomal protein L13